MASENEVFGMEGGKIVFAPDVVSTIAGLAAAEVEGVDSMQGTFADDITGMLGSKKALTKGVKVDISENTVKADITLAIKYGVKIHEVCKQVQVAVKEAVETMTGLSVTEVNISVSSITFPKADKEKPADKKAE